MPSVEIFARVALSSGVDASTHRWSVFGSLRSTIAVERPPTGIRPKREKGRENVVTSACGLEITVSVRVLVLDDDDGGGGGDEPGFSEEADAELLIVRLRKWYDGDEERKELAIRARSIVHGSRMD